MKFSRKPGLVLFGKNEVWFQYIPGCCLDAAIMKTGAMRSKPPRPFEWQTYCTEPLEYRWFTEIPSKENYRYRVNILGVACRSQRREIL